MENWLVNSWSFWDVLFAPLVGCFLFVCFLGIFCLFYFVVFKGCKHEEMRQRKHYQELKLAPWGIWKLPLISLTLERSEKWLTVGLMTWNFCMVTSLWCFVCAHACVYVYVCVPLRVCMCTGTQRGQKSTLGVFLKQFPPHLLRQVSHWACTFQICLDWLVSKPHGFSCPLFLSAGLTGRSGHSVIM